MGRGRVSAPPSVLAVFVKVEVIGVTPSTWAHAPTGIASFAEAFTSGDELALRSSPDTEAPWRINVDPVVYGRVEVLMTIDVVVLRRCYH